MNLYLLIFIGCGIGGVFRYLVSTRINTLFNANFPYGTLTVNVTGSFLIGFVVMVILNKFANNVSISDPLRSLLITGFLGGYTTFSSFSLETINLIETGEIVRASLYILFSIILCVGFAALGLLIGKEL